MSRIGRWFLWREEPPSDEEVEHRSRIHRLATYNAEVQRGLVHTEAWAFHMAAEQEWFNGLRWYDQ